MEIIPRCREISRISVAHRNTAKSRDHWTLCSLATGRTSKRYKSLNKVDRKTRETHESWTARPKIQGLKFSVRDLETEIHGDCNGL